MLPRNIVLVMVMFVGQSVAMLTAPPRKNGGADALVVRYSAGMSILFSKKLQSAISIRIFDGM
jgi:hypothetical protein